MAHPVDLHVGAQVRAWRKHRNLTQSDLATALDVTYQQLQKYESGRNRISASMLWEIAKALQVDVRVFFDGLPAIDAAGNSDRSD